jgi:hypothetical protein
VGRGEEGLENMELWMRDCGKRRKLFVQMSYL